MIENDFFMTQETFEKKVKNGEIDPRDFIVVPQSILKEPLIGKEKDGEDS